MSSKLHFIFAGLLLLVSKIMSKPRILGGREVESGDYPMVAHIFRYPDGVHICGGAIITHQIVISAAQCFKTNHELTFKNRKVMVGDVHHHESDISPKSRQIILIEELLVPENYYQDNVNNNIAIVRLKWSIKFSENAGSISLARVRPATGTECTVCGWGSTEEHPNPSVLIAAAVSIQNPTICEKSLSKFNTETMVCAGDETKQNGTCYGDKGGPLICGGRVAGLVNYGRLLCYGMTAFVDVAQFSNWIIENSVLTHTGDKNGSSRVTFSFLVFLMSFSIIFKYIFKNVQ